MIHLRQYQDTSYCLLTNQGYLTFLRKFSEATGLKVCNDYCLSLMQKSQTFTKLLNQNHQKLLKGKIQIDDIDISELLNSTTREFRDFINYFYNKLNEESPEEDKTKNN